MVTSVIVVALLLLTNQIPRNDPNGIWEAETGSKFEMKLSGSDLKVLIVAGSNPRYLKYEVDLKTQEEINTYKGTGYFLAKMNTGKECRFDTEWHVVVVAPERILGVTTNIIADGNTCEVQERAQVQIDLKKVQ